MFKTTACIAAAVGSIALSTPATAQTFLPAPSSVALSGTITVQQSGGATQCALTMALSITPTHHAVVVTQSLMRNSNPTSFLCGSVVIPYGTWTLTSGPASHVTLSFGVNTPLGMPCYGAVILPISAGTITLPSGGVVLPAVTTGNPQCNILALTLTSAPTLSV